MTRAEPCEVIPLKARDVIANWAEAHGKTVPPNREKPLLSDVVTFQNYGDQMREEQTVDGCADHAAVARQLVLKIRECRAFATLQTLQKGVPVSPNGKFRAYILDSLRHPAEVHLLRRIYQNAFILIGVVCEEEKRIDRINGKYADGGRPNAIPFMERDADAKEKHGQHVAAAFHLADFFVDNTVDRYLQDGRTNESWDINEHLSRLLKIVTHSELVRPAAAETAMHHAYSAQLRSACLSRQVGAALIDKNGNVIATGTNEAPKAGGGVYGEACAPDEYDARCATHYSDAEKCCHNTQQQNAIIQKLIDAIPELKVVGVDRRQDLAVELRATVIGALLEFSRAVHAEMDALLTAARKGSSTVGARLFVTTYPCHYCARHIVTAGIDEVQYIEPYPKSQAVKLHRDSIQVENDGWRTPSEGGTKVLFHPFSGVAPRLYRRAFMKDRELKDKNTGAIAVQDPAWGTPWHLGKLSYPDIEAQLAETVKDGS